MSRFARVAFDLRALRHPRRLALYFRLRRQLATAIDGESLRLLPARLEALSTAPFAESVDDATRTLPLLERWVARARVSPDTCLYRAAARFVVLRSTGLTPRLVVGAANNRASEASLVGHAWVELSDAPFLEPDDPRTRFRTTWSYPEPGTGC